MGNRMPMNRAYAKRPTERPMLDRVIARNYPSKSDRRPNAGLISGMGGSFPHRPGFGQAPRPGGRRGVGQDDCGTDWVDKLIAKANATQAQAPAPDVLPLSSSAALVAADTATLTATVQFNGFLARRLVFPDAASTLINVSDVRVGNQSILRIPAGTVISGEYFSSKAEICEWLRWPKMSAGIEVEVDIVATGAVTVRGAVVDGAAW